MRLVIPVERAGTVVTVSRLLHEFLESNRHAWTREIFGLRQDVPYVACVLADSLLPVDPRGFWQLHSLPDAKKFFLDSVLGPTTGWEAKEEADQLLLLLGAGQPAKMRWGALPESELEALKRVGTTLYNMAAEISPLESERAELASMALDFCPWTEVLAEFKHARPLITV